MSRSQHHHGSPRPDDCTLTVFQPITVTGEVTITPSVECGPVTVMCLKSRVEPAGKCGAHLSGHCFETCKIIIHQDLCVAVPVQFSAEATCDLQGMHCGTPSTDPTACLRSVCKDCGGNGGDCSDGCGDGSCSDDSSCSDGGSSGSDEDSSCSDEDSSCSDEDSSCSDEGSSGSDEGSSGYDECSCCEEDFSCCEDCPTGAEGFDSGSGYLRADDEGSCCEDVDHSGSGGKDR